MDERPYPLTPQGIHRAALDSGALAYTTPSLLFMLYVLIPAWAEGTVPRALAVTALSVVFALLFVYCTGMRAYPLSDRLGWLATTGAVLAVFALLLGADVLYLVMFVQVMLGVLLPVRTGRVAVVLIAFVVVTAALALGEVVAVVLAAVGAVLSIGLGTGIEREILREQLDEAQRRNAVLAVAAERERIGRDLHDILGHSLTTITVSAQLGQRLLDADPEAARTQLAEIERLSRQSLADVRTTASGMQQVRAATEIASARSVLQAAGVEAEAPSALPVLDDARAELFGYVIREAVTNVVRHARATRCTLRVTEHEVEVADDGTGIPAGSPRSGLAGLARRVEQAGGTLTVTSGDPARPGTRVLARLDGGTA